MVDANGEAEFEVDLDKELASEVVFLKVGVHEKGTLKDLVLGVDAANTEGCRGKADLDLLPRAGFGAALGEDGFGGLGEEVDDGKARKAASYADLCGVCDLIGAEERFERVEDLAIDAGFFVKKADISERDLDLGRSDPEAAAIDKAAFRRRSGPFDGKADLARCGTACAPKDEGEKPREASEAARKARKGRMKRDHPRRLRKKRGRASKKKRRKEEGREERGAALQARPTGGW